MIYSVQLWVRLNQNKQSIKCPFCSTLIYRTTSVHVNRERCECCGEVYLVSWGVEEVVNCVKHPRRVAVGLGLIEDVWLSLCHDCLAQCSRRIEDSISNMKWRQYALQCLQPVARHLEWIFFPLNVMCSLSLMLFPHNGHVPDMGWAEIFSSNPDRENSLSRCFSAESSLGLWMSRSFHLICAIIIPSIPILWKKVSRHFTAQSGHTKILFAVSSALTFERENQ